MVDAVNMLTQQGASPRVSSPGASRSAPVEAAVNTKQGFVSSAIRMDNLQNVAILEYRSDNGEVVAQYPTQAQIDSFKSAERLQKERPQISTEKASHEPAPSTSAKTPHAPAPVHTASAASAPHTGGSEKSTHSITV